MSSRSTALRLRHRVRFLYELFSETAERFSDNEGPRLVAAFSYYATFSIFPLLLLATTVVGFILGEDTHARDRLLDAIATPGSSVREVVERTLGAMQAHRSSRGLSAAVGLATLFFAASGAFVELDASLNRIWGVPTLTSKGLAGSVRLFVRDRLAAMAIVAALGFTLLVSLVSSSLLQSIAARASAGISIPLWPAFVRTGDLALSIGILCAVFTAAFHFIPRSRPPAHAVVGGAVLTTTVLTALKELFASYLAHLTSYSAYGVAGSMLALATWIYLSSLVIFLGAQLTRVHTEKLGAAPPGAPSGSANPP